MIIFKPCQCAGVPNIARFTTAILMAPLVKPDRPQTKSKTNPHRPTYAAKCLLTDYVVLNFR